MKTNKLLLLLLVSFFAVTTMGGTAYAFSLQYYDGTQDVDYVGPIVIKSEDWSGGKTYDPNTIFNNPTATPYEIHKFGDGVGIGHITTFHEDDPTIPGSKVLWTEGALPDREELTFVYWNLLDYYVNIDNSGSGEIRSKGGYVALYLDTDLDYDDGLQGKGGINEDSTDLYGIPNYDTVTDGSLFLLLEFTPGIRDDQGDLVTTLDITQDSQTPFAGSSRGYLNVIGGDYDWMFDTNGFAFSDNSTADFYLNFTFDAGQEPSEWPNSNWTSESNDDLLGATVPEPATMFLLGTGLIGLAGFGRKKRFFKK